MGLFSNIEKAQVSMGGNWLKAGGKYLCYVSVCKAPDNRKKKLMYVVELDVIESNHAEIKPGMKASCVFNLTDHEAAWGNLKGFLAAAVPCNADDVDEAVLDASITPANPMKGQLVIVEVVNQKTRAGGDFSKHIWYPVSGELQSQATALRAAAGFRDAA